MKLATDHNWQPSYLQCERGSLKSIEITGNVVAEFAPDVVVLVGEQSVETKLEFRQRRERRQILRRWH